MHVMQTLSLADHLSKELCLSAAQGCPPAPLCMLRFRRCSHTWKGCMSWVVSKNWAAGQRNITMTLPMQSKTCRSPASATSLAIYNASV